MKGSIGDGGRGSPVEVRLDPVGSLEVATHGKLLQGLVRVVHELDVQPLAPLAELAPDRLAEHAVRLLAAEQGLLPVGGAARPAHELHELPSRERDGVITRQWTGLGSRRTLAILSTLPLARWAHEAKRVETVVIVVLIGVLQGSLALIPHATFASRAARLNS